MPEPVPRAFLEPKTDDDFLTATSSPQTRIVHFGAALDLTEELNQRRLLQAALSVGDTLMDHAVALQDIVSAFANLYKKEGRVLDTSFFESIYNETQKSGGGAVTWRSYFNTVFKQERELKNRIAACHDELKQIENNVEHCERQLKSLVSSPSSQTQMDEERLVVQILHLEIQRASETFRLDEQDLLFKVSLDCDGQFSSSAPRPMADHQVFFNELHAFSLPKAVGNLELSIHTVSAHSPLGTESSNPIGNGTQSLAPLADQLKHRLVVAVMGDEVHGNVVVTLQWIKSKVSFYERHIQHYAIQRNVVLRDAHEAQSKLDFLELSVYRTNRKTGAKSSPIALLSTVVKQPDLMYSWAVSKVLVSVNATDFEKATQAMVGIALVFNCLTSFTRVTYLDSLAEGFAFWCNLDPSKRWTRSNYNKVSYALLGSIVFDTVWLYYNVRIFRSPESDLSHLTTVLSILNIVAKFLLIVFLCHARNRSQPSLGYPVS